MLGMVMPPLGDEEVGEREVYIPECFQNRRNIPLNSARSAVTLNTSILLLLIPPSTFFSLFP